MEVVLKRTIHGTGVVVPRRVLTELRLSAGDRLTLLTTEDGRIVLAPIRRYVLAELIAQCDPKAPPPVDLVLWDAVSPLGSELVR